MLEKKCHVDVIGVPLDLGANMRGAVAGPASVRIAQLKRKIEALGHDVSDKGDIYVPIREQVPQADQEKKYLETIATVCGKLSHSVYESMIAGHVPMTIGGDHSLAIGSISGVAKACQEEGKTFGIVWIDAHGDLNTHETSPSGNIHGMPLSVLLGNGHDQLTNIAYHGAKVQAEHVALIGIRTIDGDEKDILKASGIHYHSMREIDEKGMYNIMTDVIKSVVDKVDVLHISCDLDGIDPLYAPGVSTPETGGLSYREAHLVLEMLHDTGKVASMDFVEINPFTDISNKTARLTVELAQSALGKSIT